MNHASHFWDDLLLYLEQGTVIPLIGQDVLAVECEGRPVNAYRLLAERMAEELKIPLDGLPPNFTLSQVIGAYPRFREKRSLIYSQTKAVFDRLPVGIPEPLRLLARIPAFRIFVTTTFDPWLGRAISEEHVSDPLQRHSIAYSPSDKTVADLSLEQLTSNELIVYQLFGRISPTPHYAVTEEDLLEYLHCLQAHPPKNLCDALHEHHLLFIGNSFSDWLARFFVRTARGERLISQRGKEVFIVDNELRRSESLVSFFQGFCWETNILPDNPPIEFVRRLHDLWFERHPQDRLTPTADPTDLVAPASARASHCIFISYASQDFNPALKLCQTLTAAGLNVWMDQQGGLHEGDQYERKIERDIRHCTLFMPMLSQNAERRDEGFFRREWNLALRRLPDFTGSTRPFVIPVLVDGLDLRGTRNIPNEFKEVHVVSAPKGLPSEECVSRLRQIIRNVIKMEGVIA